MITGKNLFLILFFSAAWGLNEVIAGKALYAHETARVSVWLVAWAVLVLACARAVFNRPGTSFLIASVAVLFRAVNTSPFFCHLLGMILLGAAFDAAATFLIRRDEKAVFRLCAVGASTVWAAHALFGVTLYMFEYGAWAGPSGLSKLVDHVFINGSLAALTASVCAPLGWMIGSRAHRFVHASPRFAFGAAVACTIMLWVVGAAL